jgi:hypothetical protein
MKGTTMHRPVTKITFALLFATVALGACLEEDPLDEELGETEQGLHAIDDCNVEVDLSQQTTTESFTLSKARYAYGCSDMYLHVRTGPNNWTLAITMPTEQSEQYTCEAERLRTRFEHALPGGSYSSYGAYTIFGDWYSTGSLPGGTWLGACDHPNVSRGFGANKLYKVWVRGDGHDHYHDQDVVYPTTYTFTRT